MDSVIFPTLPTYVGAPTLGGLLSLAVTVLLPIIAALFMRSSWSAFRKGLVLLVLATIKAFLEAWLGAVNDDAAFNFVTAAYSTLIQFVLAAVAYLGILKNTAVQRSALLGGPINDRRTIDGDVV
jgi:drug/metabolite transporter superfamily protein YnfA